MKNGTSDRVPTMHKLGALDAKVCAMSDAMKELRIEMRSWREEIRGDLLGLRAEVAGRMDKHEAADQAQHADCLSRNENVEEALLNATRALGGRVDMLEVGAATIRAVSADRKWLWTAVVIGAGGLLVAVLALALNAINMYRYVAPVILKGVSP